MWRTRGAYLRCEPPAEYMAVSWDSDHGDFLGAMPGDEKGQATFEAYMMLEAVLCWVTKATLGKVCLVGDAQGVLFGLTRLSASSPIINEVAKEMALHLAPMGQTLSGSHVWGEQDEVADALSRLDRGASLPPCLAQSVRRYAPKRFGSSFVALGRCEPRSSFEARGDSSYQ